MNAPATAAALTPAAFNVHLLLEFAPSTTRTQARRRARFTKEELAELAANIKAVGIMQPIVARPHPNKGLAPIKYEIVAGERRWLAANMAGLVEIPALIRDVADADLITLQLTENLQRKTIDQVEEAEAYDELRKIRKINADQVADLLGVSRTTVFNRLKLLDLTPEARKFLDEAKITPSVALLIARLPDPKMQAKAAKGCATGKDLGGYDAEDSPWNKALTHEDAENYIKEEFTTRLEGTAAINKAKSEGKTVIAGKEAAEIWKRSHAGPAGHIEIGEHYWSGGTRKSYAAALGDNPPGMVLIQSPHSGAAVKCLAREKAIAIFNEKKLKLPDELTPRHTFSDSSKPAKPLSPAAAEKAKAARAKEEAKRLREEIEQQIEVDVHIATFKAVRAKSPAKLGKPELLELHAFIEQQIGTYGKDKDLCPRPKSLAGCTEKELVRFVIDELYGTELDQHHYDGKPLFAAAKRYGVNVAKIRKELTEKAEAQLNPKAAEKWPFPLKGGKKAGKK